MLRGNYAAKIDDKGRLKIPNAFRSLIEGQHGAEVFVTSLTGEYVRIYPDAGLDGPRREARTDAVHASGPARSSSTEPTTTVRPPRSTPRGASSSTADSVTRLA